jgi:hypothetical protein
MQDVIEGDLEEGTIPRPQPVDERGAFRGSLHRNAVIHDSRQEHARLAGIDRIRRNPENESDAGIYWNRRKYPLRMSRSSRNSENRATKNGGSDVVGVAFNTRAESRELRVTKAKRERCIRESGASDKCSGRRAKTTCNWYLGDCRESETLRNRTAGFGAGRRKSRVKHVAFRLDLKRRECAGAVHSNCRISRYAVVTDFYRRRQPPVYCDPDAVEPCAEIRTRSGNANTGREDIAH